MTISFPIHYEISVLLLDAEYMSVKFTKMEDKGFVEYVYCDPRMDCFYDK